MDRFIPTNEKLLFEEKYQTNKALTLASDFFVSIINVFYLIIIKIKNLFIFCLIRLQTLLLQAILNIRLILLTYITTNRLVKIRI